jgi:hypothetical protein
MPNNNPNLPRRTFPTQLFCRKHPRCLPTARPNTKSRTIQPKLLRKKMQFQNRALLLLRLQLQPKHILHMILPALEIEQSPSWLGVGGPVIAPEGVGVYRGGEEVGF